MEDLHERFGLLIDSIDNYAHALKMPLPADMHVEQLRRALPEKVEELKKIYVELTNTNPWE